MNSARTDSARQVDEPRKKKVSLNFEKNINISHKRADDPF